MTVRPPRITIYVLFWENLYANSSEHFRLQSRVAVSRLSRRGIPKAVCTSLYRSTAAQVLKLLSEISGVKKVRLKGASLTRCDPGLSDLDFLVLYDRNYRGVKLMTLLKRLRITYLDLKRDFPLFGEFKLISEDVWEKDSQRGFFECIEFGNYFALDREKKRLVETNDCPKTTAREKMRYAFFFYSRAVARINRSFEGADQNYHLARARRDLRKLVSFVDEEPELFPTTATLPQLFAAAFARIEKLAGQASKSPGQSHRKSDGEFDIEFIASANDSTPERRLLKRHAVSRYNQMTRGKLKFDYTAAGRVVITEGLTDFSALVEFLELLLENHLNARALPLWVLVGPQTFARFREGLANREILENAELLSAASSGNQFNQLCAMNLDSIEENWHDLYHRILGDLVCADLTQARQVAYEFQLATLVIRQKRLTLNLSALGSGSERQSQSQPRNALFQTMVDSQNEMDQLRSRRGS